MVFELGMRKYLIRNALLLIFSAQYFFSIVVVVGKTKSNRKLKKNSDMFNVIDESCPYHNWTSVARDRCPYPVEFHCLRDEYGRIGWVCSEPVWVEKGLLLFETLLIDVDDVTLYF